MSKKKKTQKIGTISGMDLLKNSRGVQDIPFRTGVYSDKRRKRVKVNKRNMHEFM